MNDSFVHLHAHTEYSMLDGAARVADMVKAVCDDGQPAVAITDHGNMYGVVDFYKACQVQGVKPIIGTEAYMAKNHRDERPQRSREKVEDDSGGETDAGEKLYYHLTLLAENNTGYKNLIQLASRAFLEGYYMKPRVDWEILSEHSEGVIATSGCLGGQVLQALMRGQDTKAKQIAGRLQDIFGKDNFFVEIQDHGIPEQKRTMQALIDLSKAIGAPLVATNDSHYVHQEDALSHDALLCIQTRSLRSDPERFKFSGEEHYVKPANEMWQLFGDFPSACRNTLLIAERVNTSLDFGTYHLPRFPVPEGFEDDDAYLTELVFKGAEARWGEKMTDDIVSRLAYELRTIRDMGFSSYFLIMWDIVRHAHEVGIRTGAGRGSAAGSAVSYCLGITQLDPIKHNLLFERFLNPSRVSMPDIDLDMTAAGRDEMIRYTTEKYGSDRVAQVITFGRIMARAAVRDAARVLGYPFLLGDKISKAMPPAIMGKDAPLNALLKQEEGWESQYQKADELRSLYAADPDVRQVLDVALGLEGLRRQEGIHAAAVVISDVPLLDIVPLQRKGEDAPVVTQYDMYGVEDLGLLKMDFLGLRNLDVITDALRIIKKSTGEDLDVDNLMFDDIKTFRLLQSGETVGVFQLESRPMRDLLMRMRPTTFDDIAATIALYRPGPMAANMHNDYADRKNGRQPVLYFHENAQDLLADTYGLMIYQEQVMAVAQRFAGYSLAEADLLRKAIGKKKKDLLDAEHDKFVQGCVDKGYMAPFAEELFGTIERFADYAFNRSHAYGYGVTAYQTAYLKANYPTQYMAALCSGAQTIDKTSIFLAEARRQEIPIKMPSINLSEENFSATSEEIRVGLASIRNIGFESATQVVEERSLNGPYHDIYDFAVRILLHGHKMTTKVFISLVEAGAFDEFGYPRLGLIAVAEEILKSARKDAADQSSGMIQLFDAKPHFEIPDAEYSPEEKLSLEKQVIGVYVSGHPMDSMGEWAASKGSATIQQMIDSQDETISKVCGLVSNLNIMTTRAGDQMAHFDLEDTESVIKVTAFPKNWSKVRDKLRNECFAIVDMRSTTDNIGQRDYVMINAKVEEVEKKEVVRELRLHLPRGFNNDSMALSKLKGILVSHRGHSEVKLYLGKNTAMKLPMDYSVTITDALLADIRSVFREFAGR